MIGIFQELQLSHTATKILYRNIRVITCNRKSIEPNTHDGVDEKKHPLDDFFEMRLLTYRREDERNFETILNSGQLFSKISLL